MKKFNIYFVITLISILSMSVGYSALNTELYISGTATVNKRPGIRVISNVVKSNSSASATYDPTYTDTTITNYSTTLYGTSQITYTIAIENSDDKNYFIEDINVLLDNNDNMKYSFVGLESMQEIKAGETLYFDLKISPNKVYTEQSETLSLEFIFTESYQFKEDVLNGADPEILYGLIPVVINSNGSVSKANINNNWYSYTNKIWANAVIVKEHVRETYYDALPGSSINTADILGYYVWIPRFEYQLFNTSTNQIDPSSVKIRFVSSDTTVKNSSTVGNYITHDAFTYNNQQLSGIWVGKFETAGSATNPVILPNQTPITNNLYNLFTSNIKFSGGNMSGDNLVSYDDNDYYGLMASSESRILKDTEWGAISYLSHSIYGINSEVISNTYSTTGCGSTNNGNSSSCINGYGTLSNDIYTQSTTGNISGLFDMSGLNWEYTMASYNSNASSSGFSTTWINNNIKFLSPLNANLSLNLGNALYETNNWYQDLFVPPTASIPWAIRGNNRYGGQQSGIFTYGNTRGNASNSSRNVLVNTKIIN